MDEWISVEDETPEIAGEGVNSFFPYVLIYIPKDEPTMQVGFYNSTHRTWIHSYDIEEDGVTHWMPLPDEPKLRAADRCPYCGRVGGECSH